MNETAFETIASAASVLKLDFSAEEFAGFVEDHGLSEDAIEAVRSVFSYLKDKKQQTTVLTLLKMSRLPTKEPKTFENFDFSLLKGRDVDKGTSVTGGDLLSQKSRFHRPRRDRKDASCTGLWLFLLPARNEDIFH